MVDVCYSSVYPVFGKKTPVFKLQVLIPEWEDEPARSVWYVVRETDFRNFADVVFRYEHLDIPEKNGCLNVDKNLLDAWADGVGGSRGTWFKHWFNNLMEQSGTPAPSSERDDRLAPAEVPVPSVFGGQPAAPPPPVPPQQALPPPPVATSLPTFNRIPAHLQNRPALPSKCVCVCVTVLLVVITFDVVIHMLLTMIIVHVQLRQKDYNKPSGRVGNSQWGQLLHHHAQTSFIPHNLQEGYNTHQVLVKVSMMTRPTTTMKILTLPTLQRKKEKPMIM